MAVRRPRVFSSLVSVGQFDSLDFIDPDGSRFFFNCDDPARGDVSFLQSLNFAHAFTSELLFSLRIRMAENDFSWSSLEYHIPIEFLAGNRQGDYQVCLRAAERCVASIGYGGILDKGRGFQCFELRDIVVGPRTSVHVMNIEFDALPLDEIENGLFVLALYFTKSGNNNFALFDMLFDAGAA